MFLFSNSFKISSLVNVQSTIPSTHCICHNPHDFFPTITDFNKLECLLFNSFFISPLLYSLKLFLPSNELISNSTLTSDPQNVKIPDL